MKRRAILTGLFALPFLKEQTFAVNPAWVEVGRQSITPQTGKLTFHISSRHGNFNKLKLEVAGHNAWVYEVTSMPDERRLAARAVSPVRQMAPEVTLTPRAKGTIAVHMESGAAELGDTAKEVILWAAPASRRSS